LGSWDNHDITSGGSTGSSTDLANDHVQTLELHESKVLGGEVRGPGIIVDGGETSTIVGTPRPALNSSGSTNLDNDLVATSYFEEWLHSWDIETVVVSEWHGSSSDVKLHTCREGEMTIILGLETSSSSSRVRVNWETVSDKHLSISLHISSSDMDVVMQQGLERSRRSN
jgi:hypothetical protein